MTEPNRPVIAAFDFDGTLTYRDSFFVFLLYTFGTLPAIFKLMALTPQLILFLLGGISRKKIKEKIISKFFKGVPLEKVNAQGEVFALKKLDSQLRPEAMHRLKWHQSLGHRCLLVSASLDVYLRPWAKAHGFEDVLTSRLAIDQKGRVTGELSGNNCRGEEKVRRLTEMLGSLTNYTLYAYGDSKGDKELLDAADHPFYRKFPRE